MQQEEKLAEEFSSSCDSLGDSAQLSHGVLDFFRPRVPEIEPNKILILLLGRKERSGRGANVSGHGLVKDGKRVNVLGQLNPKTHSPGRARCFCAKRKIATHSRAHTLHLIGIKTPNFA